MFVLIKVTCQQLAFDFALPVTLMTASNVKHIDIDKSLWRVHQNCYYNNSKFSRIPVSLRCYPTSWNAITSSWHLRSGVWDKPLLVEPLQARRIKDYFWEYFSYIFAVWAVLHDIFPSEFRISSILTNSARPNPRKVWRCRSYLSEEHQLIYLLLRDRVPQCCYKSLENYEFMLYFVIT